MLTSLLQTKLHTQISLFVLFSLLFLGGTSEAGVIRTFTLYDVDGWGSADIVEISTSSGNISIRVDSDNTSRANVSYNRYGTVEAQNIYFEDLDGSHGYEIIVLYKDNTGKGKLWIINNSNKYYTALKPTEQWELSTEVLSTALQTDYNINSPMEVNNLVLAQLDGNNGKELIGVTNASGNKQVFVVRYGDNSATGVTTCLYNPGGPVAEEFMLVNLDSLSGSEIVGFYSASGKRSLYVINNALETANSSVHYGKLEKFPSFGQGILSSHLNYQASPFRYITKDVVITNMDGLNGKELVGLYLTTATSVGLFRISYADSNRDATSSTHTSPGGLYLGLDNRVADASYVIGKVNGSNGLDIYGYYGGASLNGGFIFWDNLKSQTFYNSAAINTGGQFYNQTDNGVTIGSVTFGLIDPDGDGVHNGIDPCPAIYGYLDNDIDGVCQPTDQCDSNEAITTETACGCSTADNDHDGWLDCVDDCDNDPNKHLAGICGCGKADIDTDGDNMLDCQDQCPVDPAKSITGICGCGNLEPSRDHNNNGVLDTGDCIPDGCPNDPNKYSPGVCGCGQPDENSDGDGNYDCHDECPYDPNKTDRGICGCFKTDVDGNGNSIIDCKEQGANEKVYFYHNDPTGSPLAITNDVGEQVWKASYLPFGKTFATDGAKANNRRFIGKELDGETGLSYFGARYLDSEVGRFLAPDPVRAVDAGSGKVNADILADPQRLNLYGYGLNNPYRYVDPDGRSPRNNNRVGPNGQPISRSTVMADTQARMLIEQTNSRYESIGNNNGGYYTREDIEILTVRTYTGAAGREGITNSGALRADTWVTLPGEIRPGDGHLQIEKLLEIQPGRGSNFLDFQVPSSNLRVPENGSRTSGGALQFQLNKSVPIDPSSFRRPPGRPGD